MADDVEDFVVADATDRARPLGGIESNMAKRRLDPAPRWTLGSVDSSGVSRSLLGSRTVVPSDSWPRASPGPPGPVGSGRVVLSDTDMSASILESLFEQADVGNSTGE